MTTTESLQKAESVVMHELAGLLSGLWTVAELVEGRPDHAEREGFISMLRAESKKAARTFKDLQLLRGLMRDNVAERVEPTPMCDVIEPALSLAEVAPDSPSPESLAGLSAVVDGVAMADFVARLVDLAHELGAAPTIRVQDAGSMIELRVSCGTRDNYEEIVQGLKKGDGRGRALFLLDRVVTRWAGEVWIERSDDRADAVIQLRKPGG